MSHTRTLRAQFSNHRRQRFENERALRGTKIITEVSVTSRTAAITSIRFKKNCAIRFSLCLSICDYFTNIGSEYTNDHALDLLKPFFTRVFYLTLSESCCMIRDVGESAGCARTFRGSSRPTEGRQSCL
jgi:hypothetical protein